MRAIHAILPAVLALLALQRPAVAEEHRELGPHVHGQSALDIAIDGTSVAIELTAPGMDIVGFEYPAESAADRARVDAARKTLGDPLTLFVLPAAARCRLDRASVEDDLAFGDAAVGQPDGLERQIDLEAPVDDPARRGRGLGAGHGDGLPFAFAVPGSRIVSTGQGASRTIRSATEPSKTWLRPVRPWVAMTTRSASSSAGGAP